MKVSSFHYPFSTKLDSGEFLPEFQLQYFTTGKLNPAGDNVIWICHSILHDARFDQWWAELISAGNLLDPQKYFIVSVDLSNGMFPSPNIQSLNDISAIFDLLREHLKIDHLHSVIGIGQGAQIALSWHQKNPFLSAHLLLLGGGGPISHGWNEKIKIMDDILKLDPTWSLNSKKAGENSLPIIERLIKNSLIGASQTDKNIIEKLWSENFFKPLNSFTLMVLRAIANFKPDWQQLKKIKSNCLILLSSNDPTADHEGHLKIMQALPNAAFHYLPSELGGYAYFENYDLVSRELENIYQQSFKQKLA